MALGRNQAQVTVERDGSSFLVSWRVFNGGDFTYVKASFRQQFPRSSGAEWLPDSKAWVLPIWQRATLRAWCARLFEHDAVTWRDYAEEPHTRQEQRQQSSQRYDQMGRLMSQHPDEEGFTILHSRCRLANDGAPAMTERLLSYLDGRRARAQRTIVPSDGLTLDEGRRRLGDEYPDLAACVERCCVGPSRMTTREAAAALGNSPATVCNRRRAGVAQLVIWTGLREETVVDALGYVDNPAMLRKQA